MKKENVRKALTELDVILQKIIPSEQVEKIPQKFKKFMKENKQENWYFQYDETKKLDEQDILEETRVLIGLLFINYWASEQEKEEANRILDDNEKRYLESLNEKYSIEKILENKPNRNLKTGKESNTHEGILPVEYHESIIKKVISFIKNIFKRRKKHEF